MAEQSRRNDAEAQAVEQPVRTQDNTAYFEEMYEKYATDVLRVSYFYLGDRQKAEDVCQDVFIRLMTNAPDLGKAMKRPGC